MLKDMQLSVEDQSPIKTMGMQSLQGTLLVSGVRTPSGVKNLAVMVGASNEVFEIDGQRARWCGRRELVVTSDKPQEPGEGRGFICTECSDSDTGDECCRNG